MAGRRLPKGVKTRSGLVAILDALGAASFNSDQVSRFINARAQVLDALHEKAEGGTIEGHRGELAGARLATFTFGDTVLIAYSAAESALTTEFLTRFFAVVRHFVAHSLASQILFRGAIGSGWFYVNERSNTVMGDAVADAAGWYELADWVGVVATPRTTLAIRRLYENTAEKRWAMLDYDVPLKGGKRQRLFCVNWPKVFQVGHLTPLPGETDARRALLQCLAAQPIPLGTESKYFNSLAFVEYSMLEEQKARDSRRVKRRPRGG